MYSVPKIFKNNTSAYNNSELHEWLYLGSKGTGTPFHVDIKNSCMECTNLWRKRMVVC